jgi:signal transduction histidine kinase
LPQLLESTFDRRQADAGFPAFANTDVRALTSEAQPVAVLPFPTGVGAGGVSLYSSEPLELPADLCKQFATLSGRLADQAALVEQRLPDRKLLDAAKANALAEFAAGAGHEINNPLATIAGRIQILLRDEVDGSRRQNLATIGAQALRIRDMIGDLILFGRPPAPRPQRLLLNEAATTVVERFAERARSLSCHLAFSAAGPVIASADATQLEIVLSELIRNSLDAIEVSGSITGEIRVGLERSTTGTKSCAVLSVTDNGPGLSDRDRENLFDPFYSGRHAGRGLGFGLCKCWRIVTEHGGAIEVDSIPQVATTFRVSWPDDCGAISDTSNRPTSTF